MLVIGLTGLIGSGKTTVANMFANLGVKVIDTDIIAHKLTAPQGKAMNDIVTTFGARFIDANGALLRSQMREEVFNNPDSRDKLESLLHPLIYEEVVHQLKNVEGYVILVVPLLFKSPKYLKLTSRNIFVVCKYEDIIKRLRVRNGLTQQQVNAILATQVSEDKQILMADDIIYNNDGLEYLELQVLDLHQKYSCMGQT